MPNEINKDKNLIQFNNEIEITGVDQKKNRRPLRATDGTIFVWKISGIVLAAFEGSSRMGLDGVDGGPADVGPPPPTPAPTLPKSVKVIDGPVRGAKIYFDMDGDGKIDAADRAAQMAEYSGGFVTNEHGEVEIPDELVNKIFLADVDGAIDKENPNDPLEDQYYSLPTVGVATLITDYIVRSIQEGKGEEAKDVVRKILTEAELTGTDE